MRTFEQKPKTTEQATSTNFSTPNRSYFGQRREVKSILQSQRINEIQTMPRVLKATTRNFEGKPTTKIAGSGHDFSRIPVHASTRSNIQTKRKVKPPGDRYEQGTDSVADQVTRMPNLAWSREPFSMKVSAPYGTDAKIVRRQPTFQTESLIQKKETGPTSTPTITSETSQTSPSDRRRTTIGVGEAVRLTHSVGGITWTVPTSAGFLHGSTPRETWFIAPDTAQSVTITAGSANITFNVIAPSNVLRELTPGSNNIRHRENRPDIGIQTRAYLQPTTVNFYNTEYRERDANASASGTYACFDGDSHNPHGPVQVGSHFDSRKGTLGLGYDQAYSGDCDQPPPFPPGSISWSIPYEYRMTDDHSVGYPAGSWHSIINVDQVHTLQGDSSTLNASKAGARGQITVSSSNRNFLPPVSP